MSKCRQSFFLGKSDEKILNYLLLKTVFFTMSSRILTPRVHDMLNQFDSEYLDAKPPKTPLYQIYPGTYDFGFRMIHKLVLSTRKHPGTLRFLIRKMLKKKPRRLLQQTVKGWNPLMLAVANSETVSTPDTVKLLLKYAEKFPGFLETLNGHQETALILAARFTRHGYSSNSTIQLLLDAGAQVDFMNVGGFTALKMAISCATTTNMDATVRLLLKAGADVNLVPAGEIVALSCLESAVMSGRNHFTESIMRILLEAGAQIDSRGLRGMTPLMLASRYSKLNSSEEAVQILLEHGANVHLQDQNGWTALMHALRNMEAKSGKDAKSSLKTVLMLFKAGARLENTPEVRSLIRERLSVKTRAMLLEYHLETPSPLILALVGNEPQLLSYHTALTLKKRDDEDQEPEFDASWTPIV